jgi:hypothetical protein
MISSHYWYDIDCNTALVTYASGLCLQLTVVALLIACFHQIISLATRKQAGRPFTMQNQDVVSHVKAYSCFILHCEQHESIHSKENLKK